ncbi:MAG: hypothetical protein ABI840_09870 [bacterium]
MKKYILMEKNKHTIQNLSSLNYFISKEEMKIVRAETNTFVLFSSGYI